jgi:hypothetical protein
MDMGLSPKDVFIVFQLNAGWKLDRQVFDTILFMAEGAIDLDGGSSGRVVLVRQLYGIFKFLLLPAGASDRESDGFTHFSCLGLR